MRQTTPQEVFWAGEFGDRYIERNDTGQLLDAKIAMFRRALARTESVRTVVEFGCNIGVNLSALASLSPNIDLRAIEINASAVAIARQRMPTAEIIHGSILDFDATSTFDVAFTCGVLIHLNPEMLPQVYAKLAAASKRYVLIAEYYNPSPVTVNYRGHAERLFKRDFAGEFMEAHPQFQLLDYGFVYRRDPVAPLDDITWFLMEK
jgi:pseudaminic acid biosynthesis-associated methylase